MTGRPLEGATVAVVGLGASGRAALDVLAATGARTLLGYDAAEAAVQAAREDGEVPARAALHGVADPDELATTVLAARPDVLVVSPGVAATSPLLRRAAAADVPVWSEVELAWRLRARRDGGYAPWLTLTGTNGKTTTVGMLTAILRAAGRRAEAVGNVGTPIVRVAAAGQADVLAVELSSFQLHSTHTVAPQASACLNLAPDHLDWHGSYEAYRADKAKVYERTEVACVYNEDDPVTRRMVEEADVAEGARAVGTTLAVPAVGQLGLVEDILVDRGFGAQRWTAAAELATRADLATAPGEDVPDHVVADALAAAALARAHGVDPRHVRDGLRDYRPEGHRIALVATVDGVRYVDDSKATNAHAAAASLGAVPTGTCVWVAGGLAKGARFDDLVRAHRDRLRAVVLIGTDREPLRQALGRHAGDVPLIEVTPGEDGRVMPRAVAEAARVARPGDTVLLAPAAASMDQFAGYADRGRAFARAVAELEGGR